jgi:pimeloyl-ACP methyl ester carboxylesterase
MSQASQQHSTDTASLHLADHGWFYVGGNYTGLDDAGPMAGQMYVEYFIPENQTHPYPVVMFHGGSQTGTNYTGTPDGRRGWAHDFLLAGYAVYVIDQAGRGRSNYAESLYGDYTGVKGPAADCEIRFTAPETIGNWPNAALHTQWPGTGVHGDDVFDNFFASQVNQIANRSVVEALNRDSGIALLDRIGPALLLTHSQSGPFGWLIADQRPALVKGILAIEPNGPPFFEVTLTGGEDWYHFAEQRNRIYGIAHQPLTFDPPVADPAELDVMPDPKPAGEGRVQGFIQGEPARSLPNLQGIPIMILVGEASYHATYDHLTSRFLTQAGVDHDFIRLTDHGIMGNGHMMMCEMNNHVIADFLLAWLDANGPAG